MFVRKRKEINQGKDAKGEICLPNFDLLSERAVDQACVGWWLSVSKTGFIRKVTLLTP